MENMLALWHYFDFILIFERVKANCAVFKPLEWMLLFTLYKILSHLTLLLINMSSQLVSYNWFLSLSDILVEVPWLRLRTLVYHAECKIKTVTEFFKGSAQASYFVEFMHEVYDADWVNYKSQKFDVDHYVVDQFDCSVSWG